MPEFSYHTTHLQQLPGRTSLFPLYELDSKNDEQQVDVGTYELRNPLLTPRTDNTRTARVDEAELIANQIEQLVVEKTLVSVKDEHDNPRIRPLEYGDIMILMRNRTHIGIYESILRDRGIPFIGSQRGSLLDNQEIQDLEKLLDSLITPFNNLSIAQVLKSPIFAASDDDLMKIALMRKDAKWYQRLLNLEAGLETDHPLSRASRLLPRWHKLADTMPVHDLLDRVFAEGNVIQRYVASVPEAQRQRVGANLQRFHELSLELDSGRYPSLSHFLHHIRSIREHRDGRPDEPAVSHGQSCVSLMTIHASKGLEAPVVILADCDNQGKHNNAYTALVDWPAETKKPVKFQLITGKHNIDKTTSEVLQRKEEAQKREELNLLYVAITRARQYLLITGSSCKHKSGWFEYLETAMKTLAKPDSSGTCHFTTGAYTETAVTDDPEVKTCPEIATDSRLTSPILKLATAEHMIAPSLSFHNGDENIFSTHDSDGVTRGITIHRALDFMSRVPPLTAEQTRLKIRQESMLADDADLENWLDEACRTLNNKKFESIFKPAGYLKVMNELPVLYRDNNQSVYGLIDRLIINDDNILLIDYKTHQVDNEAQLKTLADSFKNQIHLYSHGVEKLWPGLKIKSGLLFTHSARLVWIDQS
jgi:ATP-dependent helicase/nuclease subunit A